MHANGDKRESAEREDIGFERWRCNDCPSAILIMRGKQDNEIYYNEEQLRAAWIAGKRSLATGDNQDTEQRDPRDRARVSVGRPLGDEPGSERAEARSKTGQTDDSRERPASSPPAAGRTLASETPYRWSKDKLPEPGVPVLAYWDFVQEKGTQTESNCAIAAYNGHYWHAADDDEDDYRDPIAWMPLPEAPQ